MYPPCDGWNTVCIQRNSLSSGGTHGGHGHTGGGDGAGEGAGVVSCTRAHKLRYRGPESCGRDQASFSDARAPFGLAASPGGALDSLGVCG
jgi:hypothetical protein